jgi:hypothetical protein
MGSPIIILTLAVSLKTMTNEKLGAAKFVETAMTGAADHLYSMLPAVIFLVACLLAFASGTSWGTFGILIPIVTAMFPSTSPLLIIGISACLAGAVCGDHCSPISDTTIMASAGAQVEHIDHVSTQLPYAITVAAVSFVGYVVAGFFQDLYLTWGISAIALMAVLLILRIAVFFIERSERKQEENEALRAAALRAEEEARRKEESYSLLTTEAAEAAASKEEAAKNEDEPSGWNAAVYTAPDLETPKNEDDAPSEGDDAPDTGTEILDKYVPDEGDSKPDEPEADEEPSGDEEKDETPSEESDAASDSVNLVKKP